MATPLTLSDNQINWIHNEGPFLASNVGPAYRDENGHLIGSNYSTGEKWFLSAQLTLALNELIRNLRANPVPAADFDSLIAEFDMDSGIPGTPPNHRTLLRRFAPHWDIIIHCVHNDNSFRPHNNNIHNPTTALGYPVLDMIQSLQDHPYTLAGGFQAYLQDYPDDQDDPDLLWDLILTSYGTPHHNNVLFRLTKLLQEATQVPLR